MLSALLIGALGFTSCGSDDDGGSDSNDNCVTCAGYEIQGQAVPAQEVCKGENGNAFVQNIDTTISYDTYITSLEIFTTCK
ncbi:MAG: hypothetical protein ABJL44_19020 [Algibacter sp.]